MERNRAHSPDVDLATKLNVDNLKTERRGPMINDRVPCRKRVKVHPCRRLRPVKLVSQPYASATRHLHVKGH
jgi:hypothetical protein